MDLFGSFALLLAFLCGAVCLRRRHCGHRHAQAAADQERAQRRHGGLRADLARLRQPGLPFPHRQFLDGLRRRAQQSHAAALSSSSRPSGRGSKARLLFWSFLLSIYVFSVLFAYRDKHPELMPYVGVVLAGVQLFLPDAQQFRRQPVSSVRRAAAPNGAHAMDLARRWAADSIRCCSIRRW